ncbi:unnamed protein product [Absidia cylindrospora]
MDSSNTGEVYSFSISMQNKLHTLPPLQPSNDAFLSLQLADYLDNHQPQLSTTTTTDSKQHTLPPLQVHHLNNDNSSSDDESTAVSPLLWVPADRHPEIAPSEFTKWLETNGTNTLAKKSSVLRRKSSVLSHIHIPSDASDATTTSTSPVMDDICPKTSSSALSAHGQQETSPSSPPLEFDRHSPAQDTSRVLAPPRGNHSLLRRKAFSARGRGRKQSTIRHGQHQQQEQQSDSQQQQPIDNNEHTSTTMEPVRLYDRPVSMSEWIDLGSASLGCSSSDDSQQGILSRVHDAESQLLSQFTTPDQPSPKSSSSLEPEATTPMPKRRNDNHKKDTTLERTASANYHTTTTSKKTTPTGIQRASSERISSNKLERKPSTSSWFGGLFGGGGDKEKKRGSLRRVEDEKYAQQKKQQQQQQQPSTPIPTRTNKESSLRPKKSTGGGLGAFFSRTSNGGQHKRLLKFQQQVLSSVTSPLLLSKPSNPGKPSPSPNLETTSQQQQQQQQPMVYHNYRLPIHVERAIYRLSHYKLANPRRPLQHQVVISNLMFWYLSVINAQQQQPLLSTTHQQQNTPTLASTITTTTTTTTTKANNTHTILTNTTNTNTATLHAHFDDDVDTTTPSPNNDHLYKGQKSGRIGIPKPRPLSNNIKVASIGNDRRMMNSADTKGDDEDDDGDDDLPLSYYKQTTC